MPQALVVVVVVVGNASGAEQKMGGEKTYCSTCSEISPPPPQNMGRPPRKGSNANVAAESCVRKLL